MSMSEHIRDSPSGSSLSDLRLILLGNIGCGKTSSADNILGQLSPVSPSASRSCRLRQHYNEGRNVTLVEAPRWYWNGKKMEDGVRKETERAMTLVKPGPHAVLLLVPISQFTEMETCVPAELEELFGKKVLDHTLVLLTCGDYLMGSTVEEYLQREHPGLRKIIERCGGRYHVINNRQPRDREQVYELLEKVDSMVQKNGVYFMKTAEERALERRMREQKKQELIENYRAQKEEEKRLVLNNASITEKVEKGKSIHTLDRKRVEERDEIEGRIGEVQVSNGLHSALAPVQEYSELQIDRQLNKRPSFTLNTDGAIFSQIQEGKSPKGISTFHRIKSFEEMTPEASPTSSLHSPVFYPSSQTSSTSVSPPSTPPTLSTSSPELRLVLVGRSGAGKSLAGNIILGQEVFESHSDSFTAITQTCEKKKALVKGRRVVVVDTPDWFNSERTPDEVRAQISSCIALSSPGPHAFLLCVPLDQPAKSELQALGALETVFGSDAVKRHTLVLFTYADRLRESGKAGNDSMEAYIAGQRQDLLKIVEKCRDRFHVMERGDGRSDVVELLEKVEQTVDEAGGQYYSCAAFQEAENKVKQRQLEIVRDRQRRKLGTERQASHACMQSDAESEKNIGDEIEETRDEAEMSVSATNIERIPPITLSTMSPSLLHSIMEKMESSTILLPKLLADSSVWVGESAKKVKSSQVWGKVGSGAQNVRKMVVDSTMWGKVGDSASHVSKAVGGKVPQVVVDGSAWVGSGAKAVAASPMWEKVGTGARLMADGSMRVGTGIGAGAKNLAQSPVWGKVGTSAKTGAKLVADSSVRVGAGISAGAKKVAQSPVWGKVGSGAKTGAKMVAESSVWEKMRTAAKQVPKVVIVAALLGLVLGVVFGGLIGGAVGAVAGSAATEVGRRKFSKKSTSDEMSEAEGNAERTVNSIDAVMKGGGKSLKTE